MTDGQRGKLTDTYIRVYIPEELKYRLRMHSRATGMTVSALVRRQIYLYVQSLDDE